TGSFGPYGCPENLSVRFFPNSAGSPFIVVPVDLNLPERIQENQARVLDIWCGASGLVSGLFMVSIQ
ncbi:hypothetical protein, partial [Escherichia coli]|uniref:hypothetical protein n=1 Tax=Escherichia coli TaxID=562 RepID=UPI001BC8A494